MGENDKLIAIISLAAGIAIGANWDKIKTALGPMISSFTEGASNVAEKGTKFLAEQKENVEDTIAAAKIASAKKNLQLQESTPSSSEDIIIKKKGFKAESSAIT